MAQDESGRPDREQVNKMINVIIRAIIDESPWVPTAKEEVTDDVTKIEGERMVNMGAPADGDGVSDRRNRGPDQSGREPHRNQGVRSQMADLIEYNIKTLRDSGDETPFAPQTGTFRTDQRH